MMGSSVSGTCKNHYLKEHQLAFLDFPLMLVSSSDKKIPIKEQLYGIYPAEFCQIQHSQCH